jgi:iron complex transport system ATP-binding protein
VGELALQARELSVGHSGKAVASGIDLGVRRGEILCLLGPNGSGKTTLFRTLLGLLPPIAGEVRLDGRRLIEIGHRQLARQIAYVPQAEAGAFAYSIADLVLMGRTAHLGLFGTPSAEDNAAAQRALETLGIGHLADADATLVSGGQRQLAMIARALAQDAGTMVLDEPTASLDFGNRLKVLEEVKRLGGLGKAVVLSTHEPEHAYMVADTVAVLSRGRIVAYGPPEAVVTADMLSAVYGAAVAVERTASGRVAIVPA